MFCPPAEAKYHFFRLKYMNISPLYLNPNIKKINTQPVPHSNLLSAITHGLQGLGFRFAVILLSQLVTCKTMSFSSPLGLIEIWLICEAFRMPEKIHIRRDPQKGFYSLYFNSNTSVLGIYFITKTSKNPNWVSLIMIVTP